MGYAFIDSVSASSTGGAPVTTGNKDFSLVNFILGCIADYTNVGASTLTDSIGSNTYSPLTAYSAADRVRFFYCYNPSVSASMNWSTVNASTAYPALAILGFTGAASSPFDVENGAVDSGTNANSWQPGSITPSAIDQLVVTALTNGFGFGTVTAPTGYTMPEDIGISSGNHFGLSIAYKIKSGSMSAENPTWNWSATSSSYISNIATFKVTAGGVSSKRPKGPNVVNPEFHNSFRERFKKPTMQEIMYYNKRKAA